MSRKHWLLALIIILIIHIPVFVYLMNFKLIFNSNDFYSNEFKKYGVSRDLRGHNPDERNQDILGYLNGKIANIDPYFFNEKEISHMKDVKNIIHKVNMFFYILIIDIIALIFFSYYLIKKYDKNRLKHYLKNILLYSSLSIIAISLLFWLFTTSLFNSFFGFFHSMLFPQGNFMFDPAKDNLVVLYPEGLFADFGLRIAIYSIIVAAIMLIAALMLRKKKSK